MRTEKLDSLWALAATRQGLLTRSEITRLIGVSGLKRLLRDGHVKRVFSGVYRVSGAPTSQLQTVAAVALALEGVVAFRSAAALHDVDGFTLEKPEVLLPRQVTPTRDFGEELTVRIHQTNFLPKHHIEAVDGIACTTLARTLCDLSAVRSTSTLAKIIDGCKRRRLISYEEIAECREEMRARGRRRTTVLDEFLAERVAGYTLGESPPEDDVRRWVQQAGFTPASQHWTVANGNRRRIDVAVIDYRIACEYQGIDAHSTLGAVERDSEKITDLQIAGWFVILVTKKTTQTKFTQDLTRAVEIQRRALETFPVDRPEG